MGYEARARRQATAIRGRHDREVAVANPFPLEMWPLQSNNCPQKADEVSQVHLRPEGVPEVMARSRSRRSRPRRRLGDALARFRLDCLVLKYS